MTFRRTRCPHCKGKLEAGLRIHAGCIDGYADAVVAKANRKAEKQARKDAKVERARLHQQRQKLKTNGQRKAEAQRALNHWIVHVRDKDEPCISCGRYVETGSQAGHFRGRGRAPHLALDPRNIAKQCCQCNLHLHGNALGFRAGLVARHGEAFVLELEADQTPRHLTADEYDEIKREYRAKAREAKKENV